MNKIVAISAAAAVPTIAPTGAAQAFDPIFAVLDAFRRVDAEYFAVEGDIPDELGDRRFAAFRAVIRTRPTTQPGLAALTTLMREQLDWYRAQSSSLNTDDLCVLAATLDDSARGMSGLEPWSPPAENIAMAAGGDDAELIALGKKLEALVDAYYVARQPWALALSERNGVLDERFGAPADRDYQNPPEYEAAAKEIDDRLGLDAAADQLHAVFEKIEPIAKAIEAMPCTSIEGLRAKALVAFWEVAPLCAGDTEFHFSDAWPFQHLFCAVAEFCGLNSKIAATGFDMPCIDLTGDDEGEA